MSWKTKLELYADEIIQAQKWSEELYLNCTKKQLEDQIEEARRTLTLGDKLIQIDIIHKKLEILEHVLRWKNGGDVSAELFHPRADIREAAKRWLEHNNEGN